MTRNCPSCGDSGYRELLHTYQLTNGSMQDIWSCACGMKYASTDGPGVDYATDPIYSIVGAIGSGASAFDKERLQGTVTTIIKAGVARSAKILDVGCGQGGLLDALREQGFTNLMGADLGMVCVMETLARGHAATQASVGEFPIEAKFDLIILSHVLEHIEDVRPFLHDCLVRLAPKGILYVEVPDASRYAKFPLPFLDFNSEHINHFTGSSLEGILKGSGLEASASKKDITLTNGALYPALYTLAQRPTSTRNLMAFVEQSKAAMIRAEVHLLNELKGFPHITIWGAGEYLAHVLPLLRTKKIVQIVDRNPALHGRMVNGIKVQDPVELHADYPIVIAAIVAEKSIREDIERRRLPNLVVGLGLETR